MSQNRVETSKGPAKSYNLEAELKALICDYTRSSVDGFVLEILVGRMVGVMIRSPVVVSIQSSIQGYCVGCSAGNK